MLSQEVRSLEDENRELKERLRELSEKMEQNSAIKPKICRYCKNYVQHYLKSGTEQKPIYVPIYDGHCASRVPIKKGGKKKPSPDDTCVYFELNPYEKKY